MTPALSSFEAHSWSYFDYDELFEIKKGARLTKSDMTIGSTPFIGATEKSNGITGYIDQRPLHPGNVITLSYDGTIAEAFYQADPFWASDSVNVLYPRFELCREIALFLVTLMRREKYRYNYGRKWKLETMKRSKLPLPICRDGSVDWPHIIHFVAELSAGVGFDLPSKRCAIVAVPVPIDTKAWQQFRYDELFDILKGRRLTSADMTAGTTAFIGATEYTNGETGRIGQDALHPGGQITVSYNGSVAEAFYQPSPFWASDDVNVFYPRFEMSLAVAMFFVTLIRREKYRYNYGRKWKLDGMKSSTLLLPATAEGFPDFEAMEALVQNLPSWRFLERFNGPPVDQPT